VSRCTKRMCYKELWKVLTWPCSVVRNGSSSRTQFLPKRPRQLGSGCGGTCCPSSVPRIGPGGVESSKPWTINCGLFWRVWLATSITAFRAWGDPSWRQRQRSPWRRGVRRQQSGRSISRLVSRHRAAILHDIIITENLELSHINYLVWKVDVLIFLLPHIVLETELMARPTRHSVIVCVCVCVNFHSQGNIILPAAIRVFPGRKQRRQWVPQFHTHRRVSWA
jgi:hypothetical protein